MKGEETKPQREEIWKSHPFSNIFTVVHRYGPASTYLPVSDKCLFFVCFFLSRKTKRNSENKSKADISEGCNCPTNNIHSGQSLTIFQPAAFCISSFLPFLRGYDTSSLFGFSPFSLNDTKPHFLIKISAWVYCKGTALLTWPLLLP